MQNAEPSRLCWLQAIFKMHFGKELQFVDLQKDFLISSGVCIILNVFSLQFKVFLKKRSVNVF